MAEPALGSRDSRLLIVDDEEPHRQTLAAILAAEGFDVTACATAQEALAHLRRGGFGVAIVDLRLNGRSGMQLLRELQGLAGHVDVIIHTAYSSYESARDAVNLGAFGYVEKGGDPGQLVRHVHRAFQTRLRRYAQELESAVAERTRELQEANQALRREIAEHKRAEEALRSSRDYLKHLTDSMWDAVFSVSMPERVIEWANDSFRLTGYEPKDCVGRTTEFLYPDRGEFLAFGQKLKSAIAAGKDVLHAEQLLRRENGEIFPAEITTTLFRTRGEVIRVTSIVRDVTERKRAEAALRESEERFRVMAESAHDLLTVADEQGKTLWANPAWKKTLGYTEETQGDVIEKVHPDDRVRVLEAFHALNDDESAFTNVEYRYRTASGEYVSVETTLRKRVVAGEPVLYCLAHDITERKRAEAALRESEARYRTLFDAAQDGVFLFPVAADGMPLRFTEVSEVACRTLGYTRAELLAMSPADLIAPEYHGMMPGLGSRLLADRCFRAEWEDIAKDGRRIPVDVSATLFELGGQIIRMEVVRDMTERKRAEEAMRRSEERLRMALDSAAAIAWEQDLVTGALTETGPVGSLFGRPKGFRHTSQQDFVESVHPGDRERLRAELEAAVRSKSPYEVEFRVLMPDGGVRWLRAIAGFAYDSEGRATALRGIARDVTERKRLAREVLEISDAERRRIGCELHDGVRQELTGIRFMASALEHELALRSAPETEAAEAITRLLGEVAEHTRALARGVCTLELVYADLLPALEQLASTARDRFHIACDLTCDALPDGINDTMATHLYHIAQEAVANAAEHGKAKHIEIDLATKGDATTLTVVDNGLGPPNGLIGLKGLGLRIMRYRADVMGASLDVRRQAEGGTIVACTIPVSAREGEGGESRTGASRSDG